MLVRITGHKSNPSRIVTGTHLPAANTAAVVTVTAVTGKTITLHGVQWSYSTSPTGGKLTIASNSVTLWEGEITAGGPGGFNFCLPGTRGQNMVITLASGTGACVGKINVQYVIEA